MITRLGTYSEIKGSSIKIPCVVATTAAITLSGTQTIDGIAVIVGDRVLVNNQGTASTNGIYVVAFSTWSRAIDMSLDDDVYTGLQIYITSGTANGGRFFALTTANPITLGATSISFAVSAAPSSSISGTPNYVSKFTGSGTTIGDSLIYSNTTSVIIGGTTTGTAKLVVKSTAGDNHYQAVGVAPSIRFTDTETAATINGVIGMATGTNQFITGTVSGDMILTNQTASGDFIFGVASVEKMRLKSSTGNFLIGTTVDAGYKLNVSGTGRFTGALTGSSTATFTGAISADNVFLGSGGGSGGYNVVVGYLPQAFTTATSTTLIGASAGRLLSTGNYSTMIGSSAGYSWAASTQNTIVGATSAYSVTSGNFNVTLGDNAGRMIADGVTGVTTMNSSTFIGQNTRALANAQTNQLVIGYNAVGLGSNSTVIGNSSTTVIKLFGALTLTSTISDGTYTYTLPSATGTLALTSALGSYLPLAGGTLTGALSGTSATFSGGVTSYNASSDLQLLIGNGVRDVYVSGATAAGTSQMIGLSNVSASNVLKLYGGLATIASTGAATFSGSVTATGFYGTEFYNTSVYPYNTLFGAGADATTTTIRAGSTASQATSIVLRGQNGTSPVQTILFYTQSTERLRIASTGAATFSGNLGVNGDRITIKNNTSNLSYLLVEQNTSAAAYTYLAMDGRATGYFAISTNDTERLRIASTGAATFSGGVSAQNMYSISDNSEQITIKTSTDNNKQLIFGRTSTYAIINAVTQGTGYVPIALNPNGGNVLIGTTTDNGSKLQVTGAATFSSSVTIGSLASGSDATLNLATNASSAPRSIVYKSATAKIEFTNTSGTSVASIDNAGAATFSSSVTTGIPSGWSSAGAWKLGTKFTTTVALDTTGYITVDINGTLYYLALASPL